MSTARRKGAPGRADFLFSRIIRSRGACERCGQPATDTAHIIGRRFSATRCDESNAWALCRSCHQRTGEWAADFMHLVECTIGVEHYEHLRRVAEAGLAVSSKNFWAMEVERLEARCRELGLDTRRRVPA